MTGLIFLMLLTAPLIWAAPDNENGLYGTFDHTKALNVYQGSLVSDLRVLPKHPLIGFGTNCVTKNALKKERNGGARVSTFDKALDRHRYFSPYNFESSWFDQQNRETNRNRYVTLCKPNKTQRNSKRLRQLVFTQYRMVLMLPNNLEVEEVDKNGAVVHTGISIGTKKRVSEKFEFVYNIWWNFTIGIVRDPQTRKETLVSFRAFPSKSVNIHEFETRDVYIKYHVEPLYFTSMREFERYSGKETAFEKTEDTLFIIYLVIGILVTAVIGAILLLRTVARDIQLANKNIGDILMRDQDKNDELGWKLVHADVFRAPSKPMLFSVSIGFGLEVLITVVIPLIFFAFHNTPGFGFRLASDRWKALILFVHMLSGVPGGYLSARFYKSFGGERWKLNVIMTTLFYPFVCATLMTAANTLVYATSSPELTEYQSDEAKTWVSAKTMFLLLGIWICIGLPLTFIGAHIGFTSEPFVHPVRTNLIPRQIPTQAIANKLLSRAVTGAAFVFLSFMVQLHYLNTVLLENEHTMKSHGPLFFATILSTFVCAEIGVINTYRQLVAENYHWWWQSFIITASSGVYLFSCIIVLWYFKYIGEDYKKGIAADITILILLAASFSTIVAVMNGFIGFIASWMFVRKLYGSIKID